jgi:hypothetical protein
VNVLETPERAHRLPKAPSIEDNKDFKARQQMLMEKVAKDMITVAVRARRHTLYDEGYGERELLNLVDSVDMAVASFYNRVVEEVDEHVTAVIEGWNFIEDEIWPGRAKTREEIKRYIHGNICQQVLDGEVDLVKDY